jgi:hypothetical protein
MTNNLVAKGEVQDVKFQGHVKQALQEIRDAYKQTAHAILNLADVFWKWKQNAAIWDEVEKILDDPKQKTPEMLGESIRKKLSVIGQNATLMKQGNWASLPIGYNHLYELAKVNDDKIQSLITSGHIHSALTVAESKEIALKYGEKTAAKKSAEKKTTSITYTIKFTVSADIDKVKSKVRDALATFKTKIEKIDSQVYFGD